MAWGTLFILWEVLVRTDVIVSTLVPPPSGVAAALFRGVTDGPLLSAILETLRHLFVGYGAAVVLAVPAGLLLGRFDLLREASLPIINFLRPLPSVAVLPVFMLIFGLGPAMVAAAVAFASGWVVLLNTIDGVSQAHPLQVDVARIFGVRGFGFTRKVLIPAALPQIFAGLRVAVGIALVVSVVAEIIIGSDGLGAYIVTAQGAIRVEDAIAGIVAVGILGHVLFRLADAGGNRFIPWRSEVSA